MTSQDRLSPQLVFCLVSGGDETVGQSFRHRMFLLPAVRRFKTHEHSPSLPIRDTRTNLRREFLKKKIVIKLKKVKWSCYRPGVAQTAGRGIALLFHNRGTRRGWVVSSTPRPHFTSGKGPVPILQEAGWTPGPVWTGEKSRPHRDSIPDSPARSQSLYRLSYPAHIT